ncbi:MAG: hypothetical protein ACRDCY_22015 [Aeromonas veronii]
MNLSGVIAVFERLTRWIDETSRALERQRRAREREQTQANPRRAFGRWFGPAAGRLRDSDPPAVRPDPAAPGVVRDPERDPDTR